MKKSKIPSFLLFEDDVEQSALTDTQKKVLVKIKAAPTARVAYENISKDPNEVSARDMLKQMNYVDVVGSSVEINDAGTQAMKDEGLTDDSGELLPLVKDKYLKDEDKEDNGGQGPDMGGDMLGGGPIGGEPIDGGGALPPPGGAAPDQGAPPKMGESFTLMKQIIKSR